MSRCDANIFISIYILLMYIIDSCMWYSSFDIQYHRAENTNQPVKSE